MSDEAQPDFLAAQTIETSTDNMIDTTAENVPVEEDSDEYDPSAAMEAHVSESRDRPEEQNPPAAYEALVSPTSSALHPLPPRPLIQPSVAAVSSDTPSVDHASTPPVTIPVPPRLRGGFQVDDDDEVDNDEPVEEEEPKDMLDVYDPLDGTDAEGATPATVAPDPVDSISKAPLPATGVAPVNASSHGVHNGGLGSIPSPAVSHPAVPLPRASSITPVQADVDAQRQATPAALQVNTANSAPQAAAPRGRLAHDVVGILEDRIKDDPRGDLVAWLELIDELKSRNKLEEVRRTYDRFFEVFPLAAEQWCAYIRWEEAADRKYEMERLFQRSLLEVPDVQLWSIYINYIRRRNSMQTGDVAKSYKIINDAFTFALNQVGMDKDSGRLWQDYIDFVKTGPGVIGGTGWQDTQKMDSLRAAYQRAIAMPTSALNALWKEYDVFEGSLNKINGRKFLQEWSGAYMTARSCYTQLQNMTRELERTSRPRLPPAAGFAGDAEYMHQVGLWKQWILFEKDDSLELKDEDAAAYGNRVLFTYKQALMALQFWPEMWYDAVTFCFENHLESVAIKLLAQGTAANPESCLLAFKLADHVELTTSSDEASDPGFKQRMKKVREPYDKVLHALYELITKTKLRETQEVAKLESPASGTRPGTATGENTMNGLDDLQNNADSVNATEAQIKSIRNTAEAHVDLLRKTISYAWIALMRAARRIQGKGLPTERGGGFRLVFGDARKKGKLTSDLYVESALIEYHCYKDPAGTKIFERGMKLFPEDERFALEYLKHLIAINDITNARAVFETTVGKLSMKPETAAKAKPLFSFFHEYESHFGDLAQIARLEKRISELYPDDLGLKQFARRFTSPSFDPTTVTPIVSAQQTQPKTNVVPSVELPNYLPNSPAARIIEAINTSSPKRPFPDDFDDGQPRKLARGESPLKGAAGRRMNQVRQVNGLPPNSMAPVQMPAPPLPHGLSYLLSIMPQASSYVDARFDANKMVELIREIRLPPPGSLPPSFHHQPQAVQPPPNWHPQQAQQPPFQQQQHHPHPPIMPPGYMPPPGMNQSQFGAPFRYA